MIINETIQQRILTITAPSLFFFFAKKEKRAGRNPIPQLRFWLWRHASAIISDNKICKVINIFFLNVYIRQGKNIAKHTKLISKIISNLATWQV